jgi:hypothetical protein
MRYMALSGMAWMVSVGLVCAGVPPVESVQGLYEGSAKIAGYDHKIEARLVACGHGAYKLFVRQSLAGGKIAKAELDSKTSGDPLQFSGSAHGTEWSASYADGALKGAVGKDGTWEVRRVVHRLPTLGAKPPAGAIVLLDGKNFEEVTNLPLRNGSPQKWKHTEDGAIEVPNGGMNSKRQFAGSFKLHVEFKINLAPEARDQGRGNSGVYLPNGTEIQVLDSFGMTTYKGGGCGGLYAYKDPDVFDQFSLASAPPLEWQTYDVEYRVQKKDGKLVGRPRVTVLHNGIQIHKNAELERDARVGGFHFQDHGNPVQYRNIWVLPFADE